jgi:hypothetical protein
MRFIYIQPYVQTTSRKAINNFAIEFPARPLHALYVTSIIGIKKFNWYNRVVLRAPNQ